MTLLKTVEFKMCHGLLHLFFFFRGLPLFLYPVTLMPNISDPCYQE